MDAGEQEVARVVGRVDLRPVAENAVATISRSWIGMQRFRPRAGVVERDFLDGSTLAAGNFDNRQAVFARRVERRPRHARRVAAEAEGVSAERIIEDVLERIESPRSAIRMCDGSLPLLRDGCRVFLGLLLAGPLSGDSSIALGSPSIL